jgi:20S proteasome alpha/beta subunit
MSLKDNEDKITSLGDTIAMATAGENCDRDFFA